MSESLNPPLRVFYPGESFMIAAILTSSTIGIRLTVIVPMSC